MKTFLFSLMFLGLAAGAANPPTSSPTDVGKCLARVEAMYDQLWPAGVEKELDPDLLAQIHMEDSMEWAVAKIACYRPGPGRWSKTICQHDAWTGGDPCQATLL